PAEWGSWRSRAVVAAVALAFDALDGIDAEVLRVRTYPADMAAASAVVRVVPGVHAPTAAGGLAGGIPAPAVALDGLAAGAACLTVVGGCVATRAVARDGAAAAAARLTVVARLLRRTATIALD